MATCVPIWMSRMSHGFNDIQPLIKWVMGAPPGAPRHNSFVHVIHTCAMTHSYVAMTHYCISECHNESWPHVYPCEWVTAYVSMTFTHINESRHMCQWHTPTHKNESWVPLEGRPNKTHLYMSFTRAPWPIHMCTYVTVTHSCVPSHSCVWICVHVCPWLSHIFLTSRGT